MTSPRPKSLKQVFQQVINTKALTSVLLLISKTLCLLMHFCFSFFLSLLFVFLLPYHKMLPLLSCILIVIPFLPPPVPFVIVLLHDLSTHPCLFHACFSKTPFILYCGLWRIWSHVIGKVSDGCAALRSAAHTLCIGVFPFFFFTHPSDLSRIWHRHVLITFSVVFLFWLKTLYLLLE